MTGVTTAHNWWSGVAQNLAGGGQVNPAGGSQALVDGNPDLYLKDWNADSTTAILKSLVWTRRVRAG